MGFGSFLILLLLSLLATAVLVGVLYVLLAPLAASLLQALRLERWATLVWLAFAIFLWTGVLYLLYAAMWRGSTLR
ncbi:MAG: hypothetical protein QW580_02000 [Nitrososphaerota archaeon]